MAILLFGIGCILFRLLFRYRVSLLLRPCSILGCFIFAILAGKIQVFTFHFLSEMLHLVSPHLLQKLQTTAIIFAYFIVFVLAISSMLLHRATYGKALKYVFDICRYPSSSYILMTVAFGFFDVFLGFTHRLLLKDPFLQLCILITLEVGCLAFLLVFLFRCRFVNSLLGVTLCMMNLSRLTFVVTLLVIHINPDTYLLMSSVQ
jgi:hypothetical protein